MCVCVLVSVCVHMSAIACDGQKRASEPLDWSNRRLSFFLVLGSEVKFLCKSSRALNSLSDPHPSCRLTITKSNRIKLVARFTDSRTFCTWQAIQVPGLHVLGPLFSSSPGRNSPLNTMKGNVFTQERSRPSLPSITC